MSVVPRTWSVAPLLLAALLASACASQQGRVGELEQELATSQEELASLEASMVAKERALARSKKEVRRLESELEESRLPAVSAAPPTVGGGELLPPAARPGECYARVFVPPQYRTETEQVLKRAATERIDVIPASYEWVEEKVLVEEASEQIEVIPATYEWVEERVMVTPPGKELVQVEPIYEWVEERVLVKPAQTVWKKGRGPIEKVDHATGEIMCLVEEPAEYKTVRQRVLKKPGRVEEREVPAQYQTVKKRVMLVPPQTHKVTIPPEYKTVRVRKLVSPSQGHRVEVPAEYETVTKKVEIAEGRMEWREILCETNVNPAIVTQIQRALREAGYEPGPADGVLGARTLSAVRAFQQRQGLPSGGLTIATVEALGVSAR